MQIQIELSPNLAKHVPVPTTTVLGASLRDALDSLFTEYPNLRSYVLDDQGQVRYHVTIFVNRETISDRENLGDPLHDGDHVYLFQALSGG